MYTYVNIYVYTYLSICLSIGCVDVDTYKYIYAFTYVYEIQIRHGKEARWLWSQGYQFTRICMSINISATLLYIICYMSFDIAIYIAMYMHGSFAEPKSLRSLSKSYARKFVGNLYPTIFQAIQHHIRIFAHFRVVGMYYSCT